MLYSEDKLIQRIMDFADFKQSIEQGKKPENMNKELESLWFEAIGDWDLAHQIVQHMAGKNAAWVHAYLHRKEGDLGNAGYWYSVAGKHAPVVSLEEEWGKLVQYFL